jgi:hypothetical protein
VPNLEGSKASKERAARKACLAGNADKGSEILSDLWLDYHDPTHIYNLGRCYEQNHRYEDAVSRFREYLLKAPKLTEAERAETEKHIATCLAYLGRPDTAQPVQTAPRAQPSQQPRTVEAKQAATGAVATVSVVEARSDSDTIGAAATEPSAGTSKTHARQLGLFFRFERVLAPGVSYGIVDGLEVEAGALIGYYKGTWLGLRYLLFDGVVKPGMGLAMPLFVVDGKAVAGVEGSAIVQWNFARHVGLYVSLGLSYFPSTASDLGSLWFLPGIGAQVRL